MQEKLMTLHPEGKAGVNIDKSKYEIVRNAILDSMGEHGEILFKDLSAAVTTRLPEFEG